MKDSTLGIVHLFPTLMGTYGDGGNVLVLAHRARGRSIACDVVTVGPADPIPLEADLYVLGGGEDAGQVVASRRLRETQALAKATAAGATVFAVCAGFQVLGESFSVAGGAVEPGAGLLDATTRRRHPRAVGEVWSRPAPELGLPDMTGYENHGGGTWLGPDAKPLASVVSGIGNGPPEDDRGVDGAIQGGVVATYLHGPVLARNPALADRLLAMATGADLPELPAPWTDQLRAERHAYVVSGKLSAESAKTPR